MGLFSKRRKDPIPTQRSVEVTLLSGGQSLEVVGESYRQDALWSIVGGRTHEHVRQDVVAVLVPETANAHDPNAISIWINGLQVGFLGRLDAATYRPGLVALWQQHGKQIALSGQVVGGGRLDDGSIGFLGVFLEHDPADFGLAPARTAQLRTGRREIISGDLASLPHDDVAAIKQLRRLLQEERDLVVRHFACAELEHRLYRCRDVFGSALEEYDTACTQHDQEMAEIRPALFAEFDGIPLLETYRQMCIRKQKARLWDDVVSWAARGIALYGNDALDPEFVNDLRQRSTAANEKLNPPPRAASAPRATSPAEPQEETLVCRRCNGSFIRVVTRGRKPTLCSSCRELEESGDG